MADQTTPLPRPICFMVMPYSTKSTGAGGEGIPDKVDFDRLWEAALRPAIDQAGYEPVRANEDIGALIIEEMIQRLAISDLVLADVSIPNGNVYYEVGMRHAAHRQGCILTAASWAKPLFDVGQMRHIRYPLPATSISDETAKEIITVIRDAIQTMSAGASPFYQVFPDIPQYNYNIAHATAFRKSVEDLSRFQGEVIAARSATGPDRTARALELRDRYYTKGAPVQTAVALELLHMLRDCTDWTTTLQFIDSLSDELRAMPPVKEQRALALAKTGDYDSAIGALLELIQTEGDTAERRGLLGGSYKKKWDKTQAPADLSQAIAAYERGMQLDLNNYYPANNLARLYRIRKRKGDDEKARVSYAVTVTACERARLLKTGDEWLTATFLGAAFDEGDVEKADDLANQLMDEGQPVWKDTSTLEDCRRAAGLHEEPVRGQLLDIVRRLQQAPVDPAAQ